MKQSVARPALCLEEAPDVLENMLLALVCQRFAKRVQQTLRRQTKREHALATSSTLHPGMVIVVQCFRSDLGLFVHLHAW